MVDTDTSSTTQTTFQTQLIALQNTPLSNLLKISFQIDSSSLQSLLTQIIHTQSQHARFLDNLKNTFATKEDVKHELRDVNRKITEQVREATVELNARIDPMETHLNATALSLANLEKKQEDEYHIVMERFVEVERNVDEKVNDLIQRSEDLKIKTNKIASDMRAEAERVSNVYDLFELPEKRVYELMKVKDVELEKRRKLLNEIPVFKALYGELHALDEAKTSRDETEVLQKEITNTQKKMRQMKDKVREQIEKKVASSTKREMKEQLDPIKEHLEAEIATKANHNEMVVKLKKKADKAVCDQKADHTNTLRLFENVKRQLEDSMRELGEWGREIQADLDSKAYRRELDVVDHKISSQITVEEQNNSASARYRCLCCGSLEPVDQSQNSKQRESFLFPSGRPKTAGSTAARSPSRAVYSALSDRMPPKESIGKDGRVYLVERESLSPNKKSGPGATTSTPAPPLRPSSGDDQNLSSQVQKQLQRADSSPVMTPRATVRMPTIAHSPRSYVEG